METPETQDTPEERDDETPEEFAEEIENDPAYNPEDEDAKRIKGG